MYVKNLRGEGGQPLSSIAVHWRASVPMLQVQGVHKCYVTAQGPLTVLAGVDLHLAEGGSLALMGECGAADRAVGAMVG